MAKSPNRDGCRGSGIDGFLLLGHKTRCFAFVMAHPCRRCLSQSIPAPSAVATCAAPRLSIVVLPFIFFSDDREQQYFADAITEDLTADLSRIAGMLVISRNTAFTYRDKPLDTKQIGHELSVSVQRSGNRVRVNAQLIDAETNFEVHTFGST